MPSSQRCSVAQGCPEQLHSTGCPQAVSLREMTAPRVPKLMVTAGALSAGMRCSPRSTGGAGTGSAVWWHSGHCAAWPRSGWHCAGGSQLSKKDCSFPGQRNDLWRQQIPARVLEPGEEASSPAVWLSLPSPCPPGGWGWCGAELPPAPCGEQDPSRAGGRGGALGPATPALQQFPVQSCNSWSSCRRWEGSFSTGSCHAFSRLCNYNRCLLHLLWCWQGPAGLAASLQMQVTDAKTPTGPPAARPPAPLQQGKGPKQAFTP